LIEFYQTPRPELYDLKNDPGEKVNAAERLQKKTEELKQLLDNWKRNVKAETPAQ